MRTLLFVLLLAGCSSIPIAEVSGLTPFECRAYGVDIADGSEITGTIVRSEFGWSHDLYRECSPGNAAISGCTIPVGRTETTWRSPTHEYEIWYSDNKCVPEHEACHALYERYVHTVKFFIRKVQGDFMAACPTDDRMIRFRAPFRVPEGFRPGVLYGEHDNGRKPQTTTG